MKLPFNNNTRKFACGSTYKHIDRAGYDMLQPANEEDDEHNDGHRQEAAVADDAHLPLFPDTEASFRAYRFMATHYSSTNDYDEEDN